MVGKIRYKKRYQITSKTHSFGFKTHKYRIRGTNTAKEAIYIAKENDDTLWWDAIMKEIKM